MASGCFMFAIILWMVLKPILCKKNADGKYHREV
jgi:hypothetical protein